MPTYHDKSIAQLNNMLLTEHHGYHDEINAELAYRTDLEVYADDIKDKAKNGRPQSGFDTPPPPPIP